MKKRTRSRELALQFLYQVDVRGDGSGSDVEAFLADEERDRSTVEFARELIQGTLDNRDRIDECIRSVVQNWDLARMAMVDRNVLRLATFELVFREDIPPKVSINEAIELGKRFSTQNSGGFINGVLDKVKDRYASGAGAASNPTD